jgi:hypothetical protein
MSVTQTVEIPASRRLVIDVPREVPVGQAILTFTPAAKQGPPDQGSATADDGGLDHEGECPLCAAHRDPVTGEERFNAKTIAAIEEGDAMLRGEIPAKWYNSLEEMLVDLDSDD